MTVRDLSSMVGYVSYVGLSAGRILAGGSARRSRVSVPAASKWTQKTRDDS